MVKAVCPTSCQAFIQRSWTSTQDLFQRIWNAVSNFFQYLADKIHSAYTWLTGTSKPIPNPKATSNTAQASCTTVVPIAPVSEESAKFAGKALEFYKSNLLPVEDMLAFDEMFLSLIIDDANLTNAISEQLFLACLICYVFHEEPPNNYPELFSSPKKDYHTELQGYRNEIKAFDHTLTQSLRKALFPKNTLDKSDLPEHILPRLREIAKELSEQEIFKKVLHAFRFDMSKNFVGCACNFYLEFLEEQERTLAKPHVNLAIAFKTLTQGPLTKESLEAACFACAYLYIFGDDDLSEFPFSFLIQKGKDYQVELRALRNYHENTLSDDQRQSLKDLLLREENLESSDLPDQAKEIWPRLKEIARELSQQNEALETVIRSLKSDETSSK